MFGLHPLHKSLVTKVYLAIKILPDRLFPNPLRNKLYVGFDKLGLDTVQLPHPFREVPVSCLNHQVVDIRHLTICMASLVGRLDNLSENLQDPHPIRIIFIDGPSGHFAK